MTEKKSVDRRTFIQLTASVTAVGSFVACGNVQDQWRFFTPLEAKIVDAMCEQIIPADDVPGAAWAGVVHFIDLQLTQYYKNLQTLYRKGVKGVEQSCQELYQKSFVDLTFEQQTEFMTRMEKNDLPGSVWEDISASHFFRTILDHTMQGFYGDPRHGGNKNGIGYSILGLPYPVLRARRPALASEEL